MFFGRIINLKKKTLQHCLTFSWEDFSKQPQKIYGLEVWRAPSLTRALRRYRSQNTSINVPRIETIDPGMYLAFSCSRVIQLSYNFEKTSASAVLSIFCRVNFSTLCIFAWKSFSFWSLAICFFVFLAILMLLVFSKSTMNQNVFGWIWHL